MVSIYFGGTGGSGKSVLAKELLRIRRKHKEYYQGILGIPKQVLERLNVTERQLEDKDFFYFLQENIIAEQNRNEQISGRKSIISDHCVLDCLVYAHFKLNQEAVDRLLKNPKVWESIYQYRSSLVVIVCPLPQSQKHADSLRLKMSDDERNQLTNTYKDLCHQLKIPFLNLYFHNFQERVIVLEEALKGTMRLETSVLSHYDNKHKDNGKRLQINNFSFYILKKFKHIGVPTITVTEHTTEQSWTTWPRGKCNRFIEKYGTEKLAILAFDDRVRSSDVQTIFLENIYINGELFSFLGCDSSGLKKRKCYMWQGTETEVESIIAENGEFDKKFVSKRMARIGLLFSQVELTSISLKKDQVIEKPDIFGNDKCFTDGCGGICRKLALDIFREIKSGYDEKLYLPTVYQIRYQGYKGVLALDPSLGEHTIMVRPSMEKFETSVHDRIGICGFSRPHTFGNINKQFIQLLSGLGIPDVVFMEKQRHFLDMIENMGVDLTSTINILQWKNKFDIVHVLMKPEEQRMDSTDEHATDKLIKRLQTELVAKSTKLSIFIPKSREIYGVCDPAGILEYGECFIRVTEGNFGYPKTIKGQVIVCKSPCYLLGDIKVLNAVDYADNPKTEKLNHLVDCIVFPVRGKRPHPDEMSGSDLDGDKFFVSWDMDLIPSGIELTEPSYDYPAAKEKPQGKLTIQKAISYFAKQNQTQALIRMVDTYYKRWSNIKGVNSDECKRLGQLFSRAVDSVKSGEIVRIPRYLCLPYEEPETKFVWQKMEKTAKKFKENFTQKIISTENCFDDIDEIFVRELLNQELSNVSEYQKFQFAMNYVQKLTKESEEQVQIFLDKYADKINFGMFSTMEQRSAVRQGIPSTIVTNALYKSKILSADDISYLGMHSAILSWKFYFRADHANFNWMYLLKALTQHDRVLIIMQIPDEIEIVLQFQKKCEIGKEKLVTPGTISSFFYSKHFGYRKKYVLGSGYKLDLSEHLLQLYRQNKNNNRSNTFVWIKADSLDYNPKQDELLFPISVDLTRFTNVRDKPHPRVNKTPFVKLEVYVENKSKNIPYFDIVDTNELDSVDVSETNELESVMETMDLETDTGNSMEKDCSFMLTEYDIETALDTEENLRKEIDKTVADINPILFSRIVEKWIHTKELPSFVGELIVSLLENITAYISPIQQCLPEEVVEALQKVILASTFKDPLELFKAFAYIYRLGLEEFAVEVFTTNIETITFDLSSFFDLLNKWHIWFYLDNEITKQIVINAERVFYNSNKPTSQEKGIGEKLKHAMHLAKLHLLDFLQEIESYRDKMSSENTRSSITSLKVQKLTNTNTSTVSFYHANALPKCPGFIRGQTVSITRQADYKKLPSYRSCCCLARLNSIHLAPLTITVTLLEKIPKILVHSLNSEKSGLWKMDLIANITTFERIMNSLKISCNLQTPMLSLLMKPNSTKQDFKQYGEVFMSQRQNQNISTAFSGISNQLNSKQVQAVLSALEQPITLIEGFPGTGKTKVACEIIKRVKTLMESDQKILVVAETNIAVDNLVKLLRLDFPFEILRVGTDEGVDREIFEVTLDGQLTEIDEREGTTSFYFDQQGVRHRKHELVEKIMEEASIILTTCAGAMEPVLKNYTFEFVVVEEASQIKETTMMCCLVHGAKQVVMIGDLKQLGPLTFPCPQTTCLGDLPDTSSLSTTMFQKLCSTLSDDVIVLEIQHRMHKALMEFPSEMFYNGQVLSCDKEAPLVVFPWPDSSRPLCFIDINGRESKDGMSYCNIDEIEAVQIVLNRLLSVPEEDMKNRLELRLGVDDIGILSPYHGQVRKLQNAMEPTIEIYSVDGFQGREKEIIIVSTVRANQYGSLGFLDSENRMNVLLTRARRGMIIIGNMNTLKKSKLWEKWLQDAPNIDLESVRPENAPLNRRRHMDPQMHNQDRSFSRGRGNYGRGYIQHRGNAHLSDYMPNDGTSKPYSKRRKSQKRE